jgi:hypothetical protein
MINSLPKRETEALRIYEEATKMDPPMLPVLARSYFFLFSRLLLPLYSLHLFVSVRAGLLPRCFALQKVAVTNTGVMMHLGLVGDRRSDIEARKWFQVRERNGAFRGRM